MVCAVLALGPKKAGFADDDDDESNGMAYITVLTVPRFQNNAIKEFGTDFFALVLSFISFYGPLKLCNFFAFSMFIKIKLLLCIRCTQLIYFLFLKKDNNFKMSCNFTPKP